MIVNRMQNDKKLAIFPSNRFFIMIWKGVELICKVL